MDSKLSALQRLILMNTCILGRATVQELAERCGCTPAKLYRYLPSLERKHLLKSFNLAREGSGGQYAVFYKLYGIHNDYMDEMKKLFVTLRNPNTGEESNLSWTENVGVIIVLDGDKYEWCKDNRCFLKNGKKMGVVSDVQKQTAQRMRDKKSKGVSIRIPNGINEQEKELIERAVHVAKERVEKDLLAEDRNED